MLSQHLKRLAGPAFILGELLWITLYIAVVIIGVGTGQLVGFSDAHPPMLAQVVIWFLPISVWMTRLR